MSLDSWESFANAAVGLALSWAVVMTLWPLLGWPVTAGQGAGVTGLFFALSFARARVLRAVFRRLDHAG